MSAWVKQLLKRLDEKLDEKIRIEIMESFGDECPFTHLLMKCFQIPGKDPRMSIIFYKNYLSNGGSGLKMVTYMSFLTNAIVR